MSIEDELSPGYVKERRIKLSLDPNTGVPRARQSVVIFVDYADALPEGIVLPLILEVQGPSALSYETRSFVRNAPQSLVVTPKEGGDYTVILRENAHNRWWGSVKFTAQGDQLSL